MLYVTYTLNFLLMIGMPFLLAAFLARRMRVRWGLFWVGALTFVASQVVHIPLNVVLGRLGLIKSASAGWPLVWYAVVLGLSAGVCEELARFLVLRFWLKGSRSWRSALMFGAGHGGVESVIFGTLAAIQTFNLFVLRNVDPATLGVTPDKLPAVQAQINAAFSVPVLYPLLGAFERLSAISTHLFLAVLVMQVFTRRNYLWLVVAILWHALTDGLAVYAISTWGALPTEGAIALLALIGLAPMFALRQPEPNALPAGEATLPPPPASGPAASGLLPSGDATSEQLDRTRFQ
jgi:uncharacterized membrane protein YhfC